jgi:hypothetical protein
MVSLHAAIHVANAHFPAVKRYVIMYGIRCVRISLALKTGHKPAAPSFIIIKNAR